MNYGIIVGNICNDQFGVGMGDFIECYIFFGGELLYVLYVFKVMSDVGLELLDVENLCFYYVCMLWVWSDCLEVQFDWVWQVMCEVVVCVYRFYLVGSVMSFEQGWILLYQMFVLWFNGDLGLGLMWGV